MTSTAERMALLREKLEEARQDNLKAVEDELMRQPSHEGHDSDSESSEDTVRPKSKGREKKKRKYTQKRNRPSYVDVGSADEADGEDEDERLRSMKRRARASFREMTDISNPSVSHVGDDDDAVVQYGGTAPRGGDNIDRMVAELQKVDKKRAKYRRRRAFDEDRADITFINEGNRLFNRSLEKHFDKFESVRKIKESLERGTA